MIFIPRTQYKNRELAFILNDSILTYTIEYIPLSFFRQQIPTDKIGLRNLLENVESFDEDFIDGEGNSEEDIFYKNLYLLEKYYGRETLEEKCKEYMLDNDDNRSYPKFIGNLAADLPDGAF